MKKSTTFSFRVDPETLEEFKTEVGDKSAGAVICRLMESYIRKRREIERLKERSVSNE